MRRQLLAITLGLGLTIGSVGPTFAQQESRRFTANGTILTIVDGQADFITADITGRTTVVRLDLSQLRDLKGRRVANLKNNESIQIVLQEKPDGRFMAIEYAELAKGSKVNNTDWGVREEYTRYTRKLWTGGMKNAAYPSG